MPAAREIRKMPAPKLEDLDPRLRAFALELAKLLVADVTQYPVLPPPKNPETTP